MILAAVFMGLMAMTTAGYAYLMGPVLKSLFLQATPQKMPVPMADSHTEDTLAFLSDQLSRASALTIGLLLIAVSLIKGGAFFAQRILVIRAGQQVLYTLRKRLFDGLLQMNPLQRNHDVIGNMVSRFTVDAHVVEQTVTGGMMALVSNTLQLIALVGLAISLSWKLGLVGMVAFPPVAVLISRLGRMLRTRQGKFYDAYASVSQVIDESVNGASVLQSFGREEFGRGRFDAESRSLVRRAVAAFSISAVSSPLNEVLGATALGVTLWYAQIQIENGVLTPEAFISFFTTLFLLYRPVKGLGNAVHALQSGFASFDKLEPLLHPPHQFYLPNETVPGILLEELVAGYGDSVPVLDGVSVQIRPGEKVAIVGESGSGKTTLLHVLSGYLKPRSGRAAWEWPVALVPQVPFLFHDTIAANVSLGDSEMSAAQIEEACRQAGVLRFAMEIEDGLAYNVGVNGANLSAGERQRVCLARALASGRSLLLLDEVTASLDGKNEDLIIDALRRLEGITVVAVTHRARTAAFADRTLVIHDGRIVDDGKFAELLERSSIVKRLFAVDADSR
ncbi:MAG: ABC transporter ATP-binding protein [Deltaproteobacteria bacterium]|nr:ABC transporter ATP-binding protein [Deltaproteobacteria bacterium]MBN2670052.1 ABC transporter ATP-binding protein [Deltaproteobacteria bacterium]